MAITLQSAGSPLKVCLAAVLLVPLWGAVQAQEPFGLSQGVIEKVDRDGLKLRLHNENGQPGHQVALKLNRQSRIVSVPEAEGETAEAIAPGTFSWKNLRPGQFLAVIYTPGERVVITAAVQAFDRDTEAPARDAVSSSPRVPAKVQRVLHHIDKTGEAPDGYEGGRTFLNMGRNGEESLPRRDDHGRPIRYREWDVNPHLRGHNRGAERLVTGSDGSAYYTADHYRTFMKIR
jgi:guanyl-specific ribonuclease Sa